MSFLGIFTSHDKSKDGVNQYLNGLCGVQGRSDHVQVQFLVTSGLVGFRTPVRLAERA